LKRGDGHEVTPGAREASPSVSPLYQLEGALQKPAAFLIAPTFGFGNAGVSFTGGAVAHEASAERAAKPGLKLEQKIEQLQSLQQHTGDLERQLASKTAESELLAERMKEVDAQLAPANARTSELELQLAEANARALAQEQIGEQLRVYPDQLIGHFYFNGRCRAPKCGHLPHSILHNINYAKTCTAGRKQQALSSVQSAPN
jgi:hypothetical protein